jgi:hypothetical protein
VLLVGFIIRVNHTINNVMLLLSMRSLVTSIKFIHLKLIAVTVELKCYHSIKYTKEQGITNTEGDWVCQNRGIFLFYCVGFFIGYSAVA